MGLGRGYTDSCPKSISLRAFPVLHPSSHMKRGRHFRQPLFIGNPFIERSPSYGFFWILLVLFIIGASLLTPGGGIAFTGLPCIIFFNSAGLGIPGVGVRPGLMPRFSSSGLGIPGVGVAPLGRTIFVAGIPGVVFAEGWIGCVESPSGMLAVSIFTGPFPTLDAEVFELLFAGSVPPQPNEIAAAARAVIIMSNFNIIFCLFVKK